MSFLDPASAPQNDFHADPTATPIQRQDYSEAIKQALANYGQTYGNQNALLGTLMDQINGRGPNLANAQLQQATQQNNLQGAGAVSSVRGLNPALAQRQILDQTAAQNQAAAGQSSINRMAQALAAQQQASELLGQQQQGNVAMFGTGAGANNAQNNTEVSNTLGAEGLNQATGAQNTQLRDAANQRQAAFIGSLIQTAGNLAGLGGIMGFLSPNKVGAGGGGGSSTPDVAPSASNGNVGTFGGLGVNGPTPSTDWSVPAEGFAEGGAVLPVTEKILNNAEARPTMTAPMASSAPQSDGMGDLSSIASLASSIAPLIAMFAANGGKVPGRAKVPGNSPQNDNVLAWLSPGEVVIPRTYADDPEAAADFIRAIRAQKRAA